MAENFTHYLSRQLSRISLRTALVGLVITAALAAGVVYFKSGSQPKTEASTTPYAARIEQVNGSVGIASVLNNQDNAQLEWQEVTRNTPLVAGNRIYAREGSNAMVAFTGRNYARLDAGTALDVLTLADNRTQLALRDGTALFDLGELESDELFEVATANGAVDFTEPGLYQVGIGDDGNAWVSVLSGLAQVVGLGGSGEIESGEIFNFGSQGVTEASIGNLAPDDAGSVVDDYYSYRYPKVYDHRYRTYSAYLDDPDYYDDYHSVSYDYLDYNLPGLYDLDEYGYWQDFDDYGHCWVPRVDAGWAPYRYGYWDVANLYGPTWISYEPWGWTPYHYGRWACVNNVQWVWVPERISRPIYAPALVAVVPLHQVNQIGWVPLAPGEPYLPRYYDADFHPRYFASPEVVTEVISVQRTFINTSYPQAITVVPFQRFTQVIEPQTVVQVNSQSIAQVQPTLDPYTIEGFRQVALSNESPVRKFKMERAIKQQVFERPVITSTEPMALPGRANTVEKFHVATLPERQRKRELKAQRNPEVAITQPRRANPMMNRQANAPAIAEREQRMAQLKSQARQGDQNARRELKRMRRQQGVGNNLQMIPPAQKPKPPVVQRRESTVRQSPNNERKMQKPIRRPQIQPDYNRQQMKAQKRVERQQMVIKQPPNAAAAARVQRQAQKQRQPQIQQQQIHRQQMKQPQQLQQRQMQQQMKARRQQQMQQQMPRQPKPAPQRRVKPPVQQMPTPQRQVQPMVMPRQQVNPRAEYKGPPVTTQNPTKAQRQVDKSQRKASGKGN
ncbi:MAG: DUF6600 domain-containing protein [Acidobacteriota bacterium]